MYIRASIGIRIETKGLVELEKVLEDFKLRADQWQGEIKETYKAAETNATAYIGLDDEEEPPSHEQTA